MGKYHFHRFNVEGTVMTAGDIAMIYEVPVDTLLAMQQDDAQWVGEGTNEVFVIRL